MISSYFLFPSFLQLNDNNICRIKAGAFERVPSLRTLALRNNRLTRIHEDAFGDTQHRIARLEVAGQYRSGLEMGARLREMHVVSHSRNENHQNSGPFFSPPMYRVSQKVSNLGWVDLVL